MSLLYDCSDPQDRADGLSAAAGAIRRGDLVVMPTDTVYGVASDAFSVAGVDALFSATVEATEAAVLSALWNAETVTGRNGRTATALPHEPVLAALR